MPTSRFSSARNYRRRLARRSRPWVMSLWLAVAFALAFSLTNGFEES
jgi:hypothetical protein